MNVNKERKPKHSASHFTLQTLVAYRVRGSRRQLQLMQSGTGIAKTLISRINPSMTQTQKSVQGSKLTPIKRIHRKANAGSGQVQATKKRTISTKGYALG